MRLRRRRDRLQQALGLNLRLVEELTRPYVQADGTIGILHVGASARPGAAESEDLEIVVVLEDAVYQAMNAGERRVIGVDRGRPRRTDLLVISWSRIFGFIDSPYDVHHYPYKDARVLFDPHRRLTEIVPRLYAMPETVAEERRRVHYNEAFWLKLKAERCTRRGHDGNAKLCGTLSVFAMSRLLFVLHGSWAAPPHAAPHELRRLGMPERLTQALEAAMATPTVEQLEPLFNLVDAWLDERGFDFHASPFELGDWSVYDDEGIAASMKWGLICG